MRSVLPILLLAVLMAAPSARAQEAEAGPAPLADRTAPVEVEGTRLDQLFADLRRARSERAAERIAANIRQEWSRSGSASVDLLLQWSDKAVKDNKNDVALDLLDQVITLEPDYAEGWNRRATLHFAMDDYAKSISDIERTLRLEPRHFGALAGLAAIMKNSGRKERALEAFERVLAVYPMLRSAQTEVGRLADELAGEGI